MRVEGGYNNVVLKVNPAGVITIVAGDGYSPGFSGDGGPAAHYALLNSPSGVTVDGAGNVFIADQGNNRIRKVNSAGVITTVGATAPPASMATAARRPRLNFSLRRVWR